MKKNTRRQRQRRKPRPAEPRFFPTLAHFDGACGICGTSFTTGAKVYRCPKTAKSATMFVHQTCYLQKTGSFAPEYTR